MNAFNEQKLLDNLTIYKLQLQLRAEKKYIKILEAKLRRWDECEMVMESLCDPNPYYGGLCDSCKKITITTAIIGREKS